jgi:hypothetical protein
MIRLRNAQIAQLRNKLDIGIRELREDIRRELVFAPTQDCGMAPVAAQPRSAFAVSARRRRGCDCASAP